MVSRKSLRLREDDSDSPMQDDVKLGRTGRLACKIWALYDGVEVLTATMRYERLLLRRRVDAARIGVGSPLASQ